MVMLSNNTSALYNDTSLTGTGLLTDKHDLIMKLGPLIKQLVLADKIILILFTIFTILGNTLVLLAT